MNNHKESYRLGKIALSLLTRFRAYDQVTNVYTCFYGFIAVNTVPLQTCAEMLRRGYEMGMSLGSPADGFHAGIHYLHKAFASGKKLRDLNNHIECQLRMIKRCSFPAMKLFLTCFQEIILLLINKEKPAEFDEVVDDDASKSAIAESTVVHRTMQSFWVGHYGMWCLCFTSIPCLSQHSYCSYLFLRDFFIPRSLHVLC